MTWRDRAACRDVDPETFFVTGEFKPGANTAADRARHQADIDRAKAICDGCAVRLDCLSWAWTELPDGIAGGMTAEERREAGARPRLISYRNTVVHGSAYDTERAIARNLRAGRLRHADLIADLGMTYAEAGTVCQRARAGVR